MDRDRKHSCKFCFKSFRNGKALGGHMRSHVPANSSKADAAKRKNTGFGSVGYGLRENPKKTWRLSDSTTIFDEKLCRECGKDFQSWKALFGHMTSHAEKERGEDEDEAEDEDEDEGLIGGAMMVSVPRRKRRSSRRSALKSVSVSSSSSSSVSEYEKEQEEVAITLMMLSRDVGNWGIGFGFEIGFRFSHVAGTSDKNSVVDHQELVGKGSELGSDTDFIDPKENSDDESFKNRKKNMVEVCNVSELDKDPEMGRSSKYECTTCNKSFLTYQALGGHRAAHKRMKGFLPSKGSDGQSLEIQASIDQVSGIRSSYQCLTCGKVFGSGQALGGHKRSHFVMASSSSVVMPDVIDLNHPARIDESSSKGKESDSVVADTEFHSWWARSSVQCDARFGMISS